MKYFLFEIDDINYGLPVDVVERIEDIPTGKKPRPAAWQKGLLKTGRRETGKRYSEAITISSAGDTETIRLLIDKIIDIREVYEVKPSSFPADSTESPEGLFRGVLLLDDEPYLVLNVENLPDLTGSDG